MFNRHTLTHASLAAVHAILAVILLLEGSLAHAICVAVTAVLHGLVCRLPHAK
jgi:hypothetical protein